jgi:hypothetical protein
MDINELFMWGVALASLVGTVANVYKRRWCFAVWLFGNVSWCIYDIHKTAYPQAALMAVYAVLAIWGYIRWGLNRCVVCGYHGKPYQAYNRHHCSKCHAPAGAI